MQSILKHIDYCIDTIWNSSTAFSWLREDNVCKRHKTNCDVVLPLLLQNQLHKFHERVVGQKFIRRQINKHASFIALFNLISSVEVTNIDSEIFQPEPCRFFLLYTKKPRYKLNVFRQPTVCPTVMFTRVCSSQVYTMTESFQFLFERTSKGILEGFLYFSFVVW